MFLRPTGALPGARETDEEGVRRPAVLLVGCIGEVETLVVETPTAAALET